jgi:pyruvate/2-oxoglutarate dehydrogenase complex dihydrolipoamide acyltransferase (E2) component
VDATDSARELATQEGVNLRDVEGTGADGRVTKGDVEDYIEARENS